MQIKVLVCPEEDCGDYYGAPNALDLVGKPAGVRTEDRHAIARELGVDGVGEHQSNPVAPTMQQVSRHTRAACPSCRSRGKSVERVPVVIELDKADLKPASAAAA